MKRIKKFAAALLTAIMMMTMTVTAYAAGSCTLTVTTKGGQDLNGQTINLYKLFDVTESKSGETTNYAYTVNDTYKGTLASVLSIQENAKNEEFVKAVADLKAEPENQVQNFANKFTAKALTDKLGVTKTSGKITENKTSYEFTELDAGYYLVYVTGGKEIQSSLVTVDETTNKVNLKTEAPSITKTADKGTVEIGQVVTYTVTGSIPDTTGYAEYVYKIHDELSTGLDFVNDSNGTAVSGNAVKVAVAFKEAGITDKGQVPTTAALSGTENRTMALDLSEWVRDNQANKGKEFTVTYYAKVNKDAVVDTKNSASLEYGNNPGDTTTTTPSEAKTPTYPLDINKIKKGSTPEEQLADAHFTLYRSDDQGKINKNDVVKVSAVAGKDGCYVVDPSSPTTEMVTIAKNIDEKGCNLHINGLAEGIYYLEETKAPDGFNKLANPIKITITKDKTDALKYTISKDSNVEDDKIIDIENSTGSLLPSTGGTGVIVFAGVAILLVFGVVVSFIRDKRKAC